MYGFYDITELLVLHGSSLIVQDDEVRLMYLCKRNFSINLLQGHQPSVLAYKNGHDSVYGLLDLIENVGVSDVLPRNVRFSCVSSFRAVSCDLFSVLLSYSGVSKFFRSYGS